MTRRYLDRWSLEEALKLISDSIEPVATTESISVFEAMDRVLAEPVLARRSVPHYPASAMDGLAIQAGSSTGASPARPIRIQIPENGVWIDTGNLLPEPFDAVVKSEDLIRTEGGVEIQSPSVPWANVRAVGEDVVAGDPLLPRGHVLQPWDLALLAAAGVREIIVRSRPRVVFLPTGGEIIPPDQDPKPGQIVETNSLMISGLVSSWGGRCQVLPPHPDDPAALKKALNGAVKNSEVVVINAGSAAGRFDISPGLVAEMGELFFHGLTMMPGRPAYLGRIGKTPVLGLPGYPVSAYLVVRFLLAPIIDQLLGRSSTLPWEETAVLDRAVPSRPGVLEIVRVALGKINGRVRAFPLSRGAGVLSSLSFCDGLVLTPANQEGLEAGSPVKVTGLGRRQTLDRTAVLQGSNDPALSLLEDLIRGRDRRFRLIALPTGSEGGLVALAQDRCHLAACHLLDPETGEYNLPYCRRYLAAGTYRILTLGHRQQGLIVAPGNPTGITGLESLARPEIRFANRQRGAGTRVLLDHLLGRERIDPASIRGYEREVFTHPAVAAMVSGGMADAGLGIEAVAKAMGLDFIPVAEERFDLVVTVSALNEEPVKMVVEALADPAFREILSSLAGYRTDQTGQWRES